jgi:hypothetical protein
MKKKIAVLIASSLLASVSNASPVSVTGSINSWKSWNAASKGPVPYFAAKAGLDLVQGTTANTSVTTPAGSMVINVSGTIDSVTGYGTLSQVGSFTGYYDVNSDGLTDDSYANGGAGGSLTIFNLAWTLDATGMHQTSGEGEGCDSGAAQCAFTLAGLNSNFHDNDLNQSVFDFQGINAGFQTLPKSNATQTAYGTIAKTWTATAGYAPVWSGITFTATLASRANSGSVTTNAANMASFTLAEVPVPAAAWLMGSGLLGLAGIARRKKSQP